MSNDDINPWDQTADLSGFAGANPKTYKAKKAKKGIRPGKKTVAWEEGRRELKVVFKDHGITTCEIRTQKCVRNNYLGFAHTRRRNSLTEEQVVDPHFVVLACNSCHDIVDFRMDRKKAEALLDEIVKARGW